MGILYHKGNYSACRLVGAYHVWDKRVNDAVHPVGTPHIYAGSPVRNPHMWGVGSGGRTALDYNTGWPQKEAK